MEPLNDIEKIIKETQLKTSEDLHNRVIKDSFNAQKESHTSFLRLDMWRYIIRGKVAKLTLGVMLIIMITFVFQLFDSPIGDVSKVYAAAMENMIRARTFAYTEVEERPNRDGDDKENETFLFKQTTMFKEPNWQRVERPRGPWGEVVNEVTITHYDTRQRLDYKGTGKTATLYDMSSDYTVDSKTGEVKLTQLRTDIRDELIDISIGTFEDLGGEEIEGKRVLKCQTEKNGRLTTIWIDPKTNYPVQIKHTWSGQKRQPVLLTSIKIDEDFDDKLFSLEPPEGYTVKESKALYSDERMKMLAKISYLGIQLNRYWGSHDSVYANEIGDLVKAGIVSEKVMNRLLAPLDDPDGPPVIKYRKPGANEPWETEIELYEEYENGTIDGQVRVFYPMLVSNLLPIQSVKQLLKPWPTDKKKLAKNMTQLHWYCERYAIEHEGEFPSKLENLINEEVSERNIKYPQTNGLSDDGSIVIQYRPPSPDLDLFDQVVFYQIYETWPEDGAMVCYGDGDCEIITDQNEFDELIK